MKNIILVLGIISSLNAVAEDVHKATIIPDKTVLGKESKLDIVDKLYLTGKDFFQKKDYAAARKKWTEAISIEMKNNPPRRKQLTILYYNLDRISFIEGKYNVAEDKLNIALSYFQIKDYNDNFPIYLYDELSNTYQWTGQYKKGLKYALLALELQKKKHGYNNVWTGAYSVGVAVMCHRLKNKPMTIKYMRMAIDIFRKFPDKKRETERLTRCL